MSLIFSECDNGKLTLHLSGRLDTTNASDAEREIKTAMGENTHTSVVLDAEELTYISSAGLRVILKVRKAESDFRVINTSPEIYDIFDMTGFTEMLPVERAYRKFSVDGCPIIGKGAKGTVYRYNEDTVVKVYNSIDSLPDIKNERELARRAFVLGIPTAISYDIVKVGDKFGSVFELLEAKSYSQLIAEHPEKLDEYVGEYANLLRRIHETIVKPEDMPDIKLIVAQWLETDRAYLSAEEMEKLQKLVDETPDTPMMLHCDYHTNNVMVQNGEALLIDMDTLSHGHPVFELGNIYITYVGFGEIDAAVVEKFLGLPYETAKEIWKKFLPAYLGTDDTERIQAVEDKAKLISALRNLRFSIRHHADTDFGRATIAHCRKEIGELLARVDTLIF